MIRTRLKKLNRLSPADQRRFLRYCRWLKFCETFYIVPSVKFGMRAILLALVLLCVLPFHPMIIPTVIGAGISIALMFQNL
jgi:hypothetical protein